MVRYPRFDGTQACADLPPAAAAYLPVPPAHRSTRLIGSGSPYAVLRPGDLTRGVHIRIPGRILEELPMSADAVATLVQRGDVIADDSTPRSNPAVLLAEEALAQRGWSLAAPWVWVDDEALVVLARAELSESNEGAA